jgi:cysteinyl-tRNA synthetase
VIRLFDTAIGDVRELDQREPGQVSMYVCGPTVYDVPHIGHGRAALVYDVLRRYLAWTGVDVRHVSNITDIDDKIIARAREEGRPAAEVAREYEDAFWKALDDLNVLRPTEQPRATEFVPRMVELITELEAAGYAYLAPDGMYFEVDKLAGYGLLARQSLDSLRAGARVEAGEGKRSPVDFALWKLAKPDEPSWPSPWGDGRPGWHTECVVMSLDLLGDGFDLHTGGLDLQFPHHENERAQAVALGHAFARHWMHHAFVEVAGEKMSKSLGNFTSLTDLLAQHDGRAYRLLVLQAHYRTPIEVTADTIMRAEKSLEGLDAFARLAARLPAADPDTDVLQQFRAYMDDDLNAPRAMAVVFDAVTRANKGDAAAAAAVFEMTAAVGLQLHAETGDIDDATAALKRQRDEARSAKEWARADEIRAELQAMGWIVEDGPDGTTVRH